MKYDDNMEVADMGVTFDHEGKVLRVMPVQPSNTQMVLAQSLVD